MARFWWVFVIVIGAAGYYVGWPAVKPRFDAFRAKKLAEDVCGEAREAIRVGADTGSIDRETVAAFTGRARTLGLEFEDTIGRPIVVHDRSCVLSARLVTRVGTKVIKRDIRAQFLF